LSGFDDRCLSRSRPSSEFSARSVVVDDRADQPNLLVVRQRRLAQPSAPGHILDRESCHGRSNTPLKRWSQAQLIW
ncbi:MAG: hypothetical protein WAM97_00125, partial [Acidimicrobiales bacterium]